MGRPAEPHHMEAVLRMARPCPYPEWMLLELPNGLCGALWYAGFEGEWSIAITEGALLRCLRLPFPQPGTGTAFHGAKFECVKSRLTRDGAEYRLFHV